MEHQFCSVDAFCRCKGRGLLQILMYGLDTRPCLRLHQIRAHLSSIGHAIRGDASYGLDLEKQQLRIRESARRASTSINEPQADTRWPCSTPTIPVADLGGTKGPRMLLHASRRKFGARRRGACCTRTRKRIDDQWLVPWVVNRGPYMRQRTFMLEEDQCFACLDFNPATPWIGVFAHPA